MGNGEKDKEQPNGGGGEEVPKDPTDTKASESYSARSDRVIPARGFFYIVRGSWIFAAGNVGLAPQHAPEASGEGNETGPYSGTVGRSSAFDRSNRSDRQRIYFAFGTSGQLVEKSARIFGKSGRKDSFDPEFGRPLEQGRGDRPENDREGE